MYKTLGFKWLCEVFSPASASATPDSDEARNPQRFIHVTVRVHFRTDRQKIVNLKYERDDNIFNRTRKQKD